MTTPDNRRGTCRTCNGPAMRVPNKMPDQPDGWVHRRTADWLTNPHDVDPIPEENPEP